MIADFPIWAYALAAVGGYLLGSIPFGLVLTRAAGLGDIRKIGSGSIGATNVLRTGRKDLAFATMVLDGGKGAIAVLIVKAIFGMETVDLALVAGIAAVFGHNFPVWLKFKGGKGVATTLGLMLAAFPIVAIMAMLTWLAVAAIFRISSLSGLITFAVAPLYALMLGRTHEAIAFTILGVLGWLRHTANIKRLIKGQEPRIGGKKSADAAA